MRSYEVREYLYNQTDGDAEYVLGVCAEGADESEVVELFGITLADFDEVDAEDVSTLFDYILNSREFNRVLENYLDNTQNIE